MHGPLGEATAAGLCEEGLADHVGASHEVGQVTDDVVPRQVTVDTRVVAPASKKFVMIYDLFM